jgi:hypothetical protein
MKILLVYFISVFGAFFLQALYNLLRMINANTTHIQIKDFFEKEEAFISVFPLANIIYVISMMILCIWEILKMIGEITIINKQ